MSHIKIEERMSISGYPETVVEHEKVERIRFVILDMERATGPNGQQFFVFDQRYLNMGDGPQWHVRNRTEFPDREKALAFARGELDLLAQT